MEKSHVRFGLQILLYLCAAVILLVFLNKNTQAYETHLIDVRNTEGMTPPVGAEMPDFSLAKLDGTVISSEDLPERYVLIVTGGGCPGATALLNDCEKAGNFRGVENIYVAYVADDPREDRERMAETGERYDFATVCGDYENTVKWGLKVPAFPHTVIVEDKVITYKAIGYFPGAVG